MSTENTHGSEAVTLPADVEGALGEFATLCLDNPSEDDYEIGLANLRYAIAQALPTTPPPLAGEGGEARYKSLDGCITQGCNDSNPCRRCIGLHQNPAEPAPPTLAPSQGTAVTDEMVGVAWMAYTGRRGSPMHVGDENHMMEFERRNMRAALEAALASPAVRDEMVSEADAVRAIEARNRALAERPGDAVYGMQAALRAHQKVAAAGDET